MEQFKKNYPVGAESARGYDRDGSLVGAAPVPSRGVRYTPYNNTATKQFTAEWDMLLRSMVFQDNNTATVFTLNYGNDYTIQIARANMTLIAPNWFTIALPHFVLAKGNIFAITAAPSANSWQVIIDTEPADFIERKLFF